MKFWRMVKNQISEGAPATADVYIYGDVVGSWWDAFSPDDTYPRQFAEDLAALGDVQEIHLHINSLGGDLWAAQAIHSLLRDHPARVITHIDGVAASAASVIAMAGDEVLMPINGMMMIHNPILSTTGDARQLRADADFLDQVRDTIIAVYQAKTGLERSTLINMMNSGTWMTADEARNYGFVDTIVEPIPVAASAKLGRFIVNGTELDFRGTREWPEQLLAAAATNSGAEAAVSDDASGSQSAGELDASSGDITETDDAGNTDDANATDNEQPIDAAIDIDALIASERRRVLDILDLHVPGADDIIRSGIESGASPGDVAQSILKNDSVRNAQLLAARRRDAPQAVPGGSEPELSVRDTRVNALVAAYKRIRGLNQ